MFCYHEIDLDQDGRLNGIEVASTRIDRKWMNDMKSVDKNRDGGISRQELKTFLKKDTQSSNNRKDARIQTDDTNDIITNFFGGKDKDGDGFVSFKEFTGRNDEL